MAHRKYEAPRHGSLGFLPRKRCKKNIGKIRSFPKDKTNQKCHLTAILGYKVGMTHVVREIPVSGRKNSPRDVIESVSIVETPPVKIMGVIGYIRTPKGLKSFKTVWSCDLDDNFRRNFYKNWFKCKKRAFANKLTKSGGDFDKEVEMNFSKISRYCNTVRCLISSQVNLTNLPQKKTNIIEVQVNGGTIFDKIDFCKKILGRSIAVSDNFNEGEKIDIIGVTKGKGFQGVISRWGVTKLPRKTHRGARKVACVGAWHPSRVSFTVPRAGQKGFHHRTHLNSMIYRIIKEQDPFGASTTFDPNEKPITPMGGFPFYGIVKSDSLILKGNVLGTKKRVITLRKSIRENSKSSDHDSINLKFIDTSSKFGHGRFQTSHEKKMVLMKSF